MKVSVLVNNYNYEDFVGPAIQSALDQSERDIEVVVVDDGSTDRSRAIIDSFSDPRIVRAYKENGGQGSAFLEGIARARGEYVAFLDSDDLWLPRKLERCLQILEGDPEISLLCHAFENIDHAGQPAQGETGPENTGYFDQWRAYKKLRSDLPFSPTSCVMTRARFAREVSFNPDQWRYAADTPLLATLSALGKVYTLNERLGRYRRHRAGGVSGFEHDQAKSLARLGIGPGNYERVGGKPITSIFVAIQYLFYQALNEQLARQGRRLRFDYRRSPEMRAMDVSRYPGASLRGIIARARFRLAVRKYR